MSPNLVLRQLNDNEKEDMLLVWFDKLYHIMLYTLA